MQKSDYDKGILRCACFDVKVLKERIDIYTVQEQTAYKTAVPLCACRCFEEIGRVEPLYQVLYTIAFCAPEEIQIFLLLLFQVFSDR